MWHDYTALAEQRLQELYKDADMRRSMPPSPRHFSQLREALGHTLVRWGERLAGASVGAPVAHR